GSGGSIILDANVGLAGGTTSLTTDGSGTINGNSFNVLGKTVHLTTGGGDIVGTTSLQTQASIFTINAGNGAVSVNTSTKISLLSSISGSINLTASGSITLLGTISAPSITVKTNSGSAAGILVGAALNAGAGTIDLETDQNGAIAQG